MLQVVNLAHFAEWCHRLSKHKACVSFHSSYANIPTPITAISSSLRSKSHIFPPPQEREFSWNTKF